MQKLRFFIFLLLLPSVLYAQQRTKINLQGSESITHDNKSKITHLKKPIFEHDGAILSSDSARWWSELNYFEAFGNVHIYQDTINIYSDLLKYDGNAKKAHLLNKVRMTDPSTVLTTNIFDYNMATRVGTYVENGKIVNNQGTTVTSKKGYYLSSTKDAYFRYDVVVVTDSVTIKSDSLRYNTFTNQTYFYGPTNIKGKDDNLYTENGEYNTKSQIAFFGKKNVYTQNTKTLKGDSLYYDGKKGYGKAVKNIIFTDSEDKLLLRGQLGEYYKEGERVVVTKNAYVGLGTSDSVTVNGKLIPDTLWLGADILEAQKSLQKSLKLIQKPTVLQDDEIGVEEEKSKTEGLKKDQPASTPTSTPISKTTLPKQNPKGNKKEKAKEKEEKDKVPLIDSTKIKIDSIKPLTDSVKSNLKIISKEDSLTKDSSIKIQKPLIKDSVKAVASKVNTTKITPKKGTITGPKAPTASIKSAVKDSIPFNPADTVRTRTIRAYHNVRVFKTNLQAKSDSLFFAAADSTLRLYQNPILWADSSQQTGDTILVQFKNKKINSAQVLQNAFIAHQETDTTKFNQIKGKIITAFFNNGEIKNMYIDGNAESISYDKDSEGKYQQNQTISARLKVTFEDKEIARVKAVKGIEGAFSPPAKVAKEGMLTGFIWKPEIRPKNKNDVINGLPEKNPLKGKATTSKQKASSKINTKKPLAKPLKSQKKTNENISKESKSTVKPDSNKVAIKPVLPELKLDTSKKN